MNVTPVVAIDWTKCFGYTRLIAEEIDHYSKIEVTPDLKEGGLAANPAWERWYRFLAATWRTDFGTEIVAAARRHPAPRLLSLGCGYGGMEIECARRLEPGYELLALDVNPGLFHSARQQTAREGLNVEFQAVDLNFVELPEDAFDVVFAHASLHHLLNFEHVFAQAQRSLRDGGRFIVLDIIGKTQVLFWPENIRFATNLVARMPERYRRRLEVEPAALFTHYLEGADQQGMEGIRQEDLEDELADWFRPLKMFKYNAFVRLICTHPDLVPLFDLQRTEDAEYLDSLFRLDLEQIETGGLRATEMFAVYEKSPVRRSAAAPRTGAGPRVSVCVVCDGSAESLRTCLASVLAQSHRNLEVILLLPSGIPDSVSKQALEILGDRVPVRAIPATSIEGRRALDWRSALAAATGDYVACLSSQDAWYPIKLAEQVALLETDPDLAITYAQAMVVDGRGRRTSRHFGTDIVGEDLTSSDQETAGDDRVPRSSALFRRYCLERTAPVHPDASLDGEVARRLADTWQVRFQERPLSMLRMPAETATNEQGLPEEPAAGSGGAAKPPVPVDSPASPPARSPLLRRALGLLAGRHRR